MLRQSRQVGGDCQASMRRVNVLLREYRGRRKTRENNDGEQNSDFHKASRIAPNDTPKPSQIYNSAEEESSYSQPSSVYALTARSPDNRAVIVISAFSSREMGQPALAFSAAFSNAVLSTPGIRAETSRWTFVIVKPASSFSSVTAAAVSRLSGGMPALPSCAESAIVKHPACAAAINSSGFVPAPFSKRVENEYCVFERTPLSVEIVPLPSFSEPFQTAEALRTIIVILLNDWISRPCKRSLRHGRASRITHARQNLKLTVTSPGRV